MPYERFDADHLLSAALATGFVGLGLVWVPTPIAVDGSVLVSTENNGTRLYHFDAAGRIIPEPAAAFAGVSASRPPCFATQASALARVRL